MRRLRRRGLETEPRMSLSGHEGGNPGHSQGNSYGSPRQPSTLQRPEFKDFSALYGYDLIVPRGFSHNPKE